MSEEDKGGPYLAEFHMKVLLPNNYSLFGAAINIPNIMTTVQNAIVNEYGGYECNVDIEFRWLTDMSTGELASEINRR